MTTFEFGRYYVPAAMALFGDGPDVLYNVEENIFRSLDRAIGASHYSEWFHDGNDGNHLPTEHINLLLKLRGSHGHAILKAYRINKGLENGGESIPKPGEGHCQEAS